jgi:hypothetical protein
MMKDLLERKDTPEETFEAVISLYVTIIATLSSGTMKVLRYDKRTYSMDIDSLSFKCDVELKARRALDQESYNMFCALLNSDSPLSLYPIDMKKRLGKVWSEYSMGVDGHYRKLFFLYKNALDRKKEMQNGRLDENLGAASSAGF